MYYTIFTGSYQQYQLLKRKEKLAGKQNTTTGNEAADETSMVINM